MSDPIKVAEAQGVPESACPHCGEVFDRATGVGHGHHPVPGSISLCIACGEFNWYGEDLRLEKIDAMELLRDQLDPVTGPLLEKVKGAWCLTMLQKGKGGV